MKVRKTLGKAYNDPCVWSEKVPPLLCPRKPGPHLDERGGDVALHLSLPVEQALAALAVQHEHVYVLAAHEPQQVREALRADLNNAAVRAAKHPRKQLLSTGNY